MSHLPVWFCGLSMLFLNMLLLFHPRFILHLRWVGRAPYFGGRYEVVGKGGVAVYYETSGSRTGQKTTMHFLTAGDRIDTYCRHFDIILGSISRAFPPAPPHPHARRAL